MGGLGMWYTFANRRGAGGLGSASCSRSDFGDGSGPEGGRPLCFGRAWPRLASEARRTQAESKDALPVVGEGQPGLAREPWRSPVERSSKTLARARQIPERRGHTACLGGAVRNQMQRGLPCQSPANTPHHTHPQRPKDVSLGHSERGVTTTTGARSRRWAKARGFGWGARPGLRGRLDRRRVPRRVVRRGVSPGRV